MPGRRLVLALLLVIAIWETSRGVMGEDLRQFHLILGGTAAALAGMMTFSRPL